MSNTHSEDFSTYDCNNQYHVYDPEEYADYYNSDLDRKWYTCDNTPCPLRALFNGALPQGIDLLPSWARDTDASQIRLIVNHQRRQAALAETQAEEQEAEEETGEEEEGRGGEGW